MDFFWGVGESGSAFYLLLFVFVCGVFDFFVVVVFFFFFFFFLGGWSFFSLFFKCLICHVGNIAAISTDHIVLIIGLLIN